MSLIGFLQWAVSIGRLDIAVFDMTLSSFREMPRKGHLDRAKCIVGHLCKMNGYVICFRTEEPDFSELPEQDISWAQSIYGNTSEFLPCGAPQPLSKLATMTHYVDANLYHDFMTGRSVTSILTLINKTPVEWYAKKQATVKCATSGSEFIATRICIDQAVDFRITLWYLGVPLHGTSMFGDNNSVIESPSTPVTSLHKKYHALSFHCIREAITSDIIKFYL